jgi:hypothetical protein
VFRLDHRYIELVYAPLIGPTAVLLARDLERRITTAGGPTSVDPLDVARQLGLRASGGQPLGSRAPLRRALDRLDHAHFVRWIGNGDLHVFLGVPPVAEQTARRLPAAARTAHALMLQEIHRDDGRDSSPFD